jgi:nuclear cap-binding protein subunit 2
MASVVTPLDQPSNYKDSQARLDRQKQHEFYQKSTTLYIGNLSFFTTESKFMTCSQSVPIPKMVAV